MPLRNIQVAVGLIRNSNGAWLCCQRAEADDHGGLWEFPGGKFEPGENLFQALTRELDEELGWQDFEPEQLTAYCDFVWHHPGKSVHLHCGLVELDHTPVFQVRVHQQCAWLTLEQMRHKDWLASNVPIIENLSASYR